MKLHSPACDRNQGVIAEKLKTALTDCRHVLEIASGTGQHATSLTQSLPWLKWQPTDYSEESLQSIAAYIEECQHSRIMAPLRLDVNCMEDWAKVPVVDAIFCSNMIHISQWQSCQNLFMLSGQRLIDKGLLILYGPFIRKEVETAPSNIEFDLFLKSQNPEWGIRDLDKVDFCALKLGLERIELIEMPANNLIVIYRKT